MKEQKNIDLHPHEKAIVQAFITAARRTRWAESLASRKRRNSVLDKLNHCPPLDERYARLLPSNTDVLALLRSRRAPATCYVLSCTGDIDGRVMPLDEAISATEIGGWGTIIGCIPGRLAYYYGECGEVRMLLERDS